MNQKGVINLVTALLLLNASLMTVQGNLSAKAADWKSAYQTQVQETLQEMSPTDETMGYSLYDLTGDGQPELIICYGFGTGFGAYNLYTYRNGKAELYYQSEARFLRLDTAKHDLLELTGGRGYYGYNIYHMDGTNITFVEGIEYEEEYTYTNASGEISVISEEKADEILNIYHEDISLGHEYKLTDLSAFDADDPVTEPPPEPTKEEKSILSESEIREKASTHGQVYLFDYHDYDENGTKEAFAVIAEEGSYGDEVRHVYFIDENGNETEMLNHFDNRIIVSTARYAEYKGQGFFSFDANYGGSGWTAFIYSVRNNIPYELDLSGKIQGFYQADDGSLYTTVNEFEPNHKYINTPLTYADGQFYLAEEVPTTQPATEQTEIIQTLPIWYDAYETILTEFKASSQYHENAEYALFDIDGNGIPELFITPNTEYGEKTSYGDQLYGYDNNKAVRYWSGENSDLISLITSVDSVPSAIVAPDAHIVAFTFGNGDGSSYYYDYWKIDNTTLTHLGLFWSKIDPSGNQQNDSYGVMKNQESKSLTKEEFESQTADYQNMTWVSPYENCVSINDNSLLASWKGASVKIPDPVQTTIQINPTEPKPENEHSESSFQESGSESAVSTVSSAVKISLISTKITTVTTYTTSTSSNPGIPSHSDTKDSVLLIKITVGIAVLYLIACIFIFGRKS